MGKIYIGTAGWSYKDWQGIVYPPGLKKSVHPVEFLARYFDLVEINTSFYGHIRPEWGKLWCAKAAAVNPDFMFTAKLNKGFTHSPLGILQSTSADTIRPGNDDERLAKEGLDSLASEGKLGALLLQFPVSFKNTEQNREYLESLIQRFGEYPISAEVRHDSWNNDAILSYFVERGVAFCNIDQPKLGRSITRTEHVTSGIGYIRLHGRNYDQWFEHEKSSDRYNYLYSPKELAGWKDKIARVTEKAPVTFVVANNHFQGKAAVNALELKHMITKQPVQAPESLVQHYPQLETLLRQSVEQL